MRFVRGRSAGPGGQGASTGGEPAPRDLAAFAEDPEAYLTLGRDQDRVLTDRYCVTFSPGEHFWSVSVQRVRFGPDVERRLEEVRRLMASRARTAAAWMIGPSATPERLRASLIGLGLEAESDEGSTILVLTDRPRVQPATFDIQPVTTFEQHVAADEVGIEGFGFPHADAEDERSRARETFDAERRGKHTVRFVAFDGDRPVATGRGSLTALGIYLSGGATIPAARGRGAMSSIVATAWEEAVRRGTPALVTHAGPMAAPTLQRLGFRATGSVHHLIDRIATVPGADRSRP